MCCDTDEEFVSEPGGIKVRSAESPAVTSSLHLLGRIEGVGRKKNKRKEKKKEKRFYLELKGKKS